MRFLLCGLLCSMLLLQPVFAHLEGERVDVGSLAIEFSRVPETPTTADTTNLVFALENSAAERLPGVPAFIRLSQGDHVLFASTEMVTDWNGVVGIAYRFPAPGEYQALVRFSANETVEHTFTLTIPEEAGLAVSWTWLIVGIILGTVLGAAGYWVLT